VALLHNPTLKRPALDAVDLRVDHDLENRCQCWLRQAALGMRSGVRQKDMGRIEAAGRLEIEAVAAAFWIDDGYGAPTFWHATQNITIGDEKAKIGKGRLNRRTELRRLRA
jgi:hypothetical protein